MNPESKECVKEWVSGMKLECFTPPSRPLFKEQEQQTARKMLSTTASSRGRKWGPRAVRPGSADPKARPNHGWPPWLIDGAHCPQQLSCFDALVLSHTLLWKEVQINFSKDFYAQKYFLGFL
jgi:hypothetical protein